MIIENKLTVDDYTKAEGIQMTTPMLATAYVSVLEACDLFERVFVTPILQGLLNRTPRETCFIGLHHRVLGFVKTVVVLRSVVHHQSLAGAARAVIELHVDIELLHANQPADCVRRFLAHVDLQKLKAAHRMVQFVKDNPTLPHDPQGHPHQDAFIAQNASRIEAERATLWGSDKKGKPVRPEHWTGKNLLERVKPLDTETQMLVIRQYDIRNFSVHTGLAGIIGFELSGFETLCFLSLKAIADCLVRQLHILGKEFKLYAVVNDYWNTLGVLENVAANALVDAKLRSIGEPSRFILHEPSKAAVLTT